MLIRSELPKKRPDLFLHFLAPVDERRGMYSFCCESQPLATVRSYSFRNAARFARNRILWVTAAR
jgi:hypothetical protein